MAASSSHSAAYQLKPADRQRINALPSRSRTQIFIKYRESLRSHKVATRSLALSQSRDFRAQKNLLSHHSDEIDSVEDARAFCIPPHWVTVVDDLNRDVATIEIKSAMNACPTSLAACRPLPAAGRALPLGSARRPPHTIDHTLPHAFSQSTICRRRRASTCCRRSVRRTSRTMRRESPRPCRSYRTSSPSASASSRWWPPRIARARGMRCAPTAQASHAPSCSSLSFLASTRTAAITARAWCTVHARIPAHSANAFGLP